MQFFKVKTVLWWNVRPLWGLAVACATIGVFWLPWCCPPTSPVLSESYTLGFNNRVAVISLAIAIFILTTARLVQSGRPHGISWLSRNPHFLVSRKSSRLEYAILLGWTFIWTQVIWNWGTSLVDPAYGDSRGTIYALDLVALGQVPYRDFLFNYGALLIYLPYSISWLSQGAISFEYSHLLALEFLIAAGFAAIFIILRKLCLPRIFRPWILLVALFSWTTLTTCMAQVAIRFVCVPTAIILLDCACTRFRSEAQLAVFKPFLASFALTLSCLLLSPEMGIAATAAVVAYAAGLSLFRHKHSLALGIVAGALFSIAAIISLFPRYFDAVFAFTSGFFNMPLYPNVHNILLLSSSLWVVPSLIASALRRPDDMRAPLALGLAVSAGILLPGAFGRAVPGVVFANGTLLFLLAFAAVASHGKQWLSRWIWVYAFANIFLLQVSFWSVNAGTFSTALALRRFYDQNPEMVASWKRKWDARRSTHPCGERLYWSSTLPYPDDLDVITAAGHTIQTGGSEWNLWLGRYLLLQDSVPKDYFSPYIFFASTAAHIDQRVEDLAAARFLIVPEDDLAAAASTINPVAYQQSLDRFLGYLMCFPVRTRIKFAPYFPDVDIAQKLLAQYQPKARFHFLIFRPFVILEQKPVEINLE